VTAAYAWSQTNKTLTANFNIPAAAQNGEYKILHCCPAKLFFDSITGVESAA
jgi:hypothetical protein